jgi:NO-binding membrane sensor protein with MHYT domain
MAPIAEKVCEFHSGVEARMDNLEKSDTDQWTAIKEIQKRPPVWTTALISMLTFLLGCTVTYASMAVKIAEMTKKP